MGLKRFMNVRLLLAFGLAGGLISAVACGGASEAPAATTAPAATPASSGGGAAVPTAMPEATAPAAMAEKTGGHVNLLVTNIGNGKFDPLLTEGEDLKFQRIFGVALVGGAGGSELVPAVAKDWSVSEDGKVWTFTVNEGFIKDHDGHIITRDDVFFNLDSRLGAEAQQLLESAYYEPRDVALTALIDSVSKGPADDQVQVAFNTVRLDFSFNWSENAQGADAMIVSEAAMRERAGATGFEGYEGDPIGIGSMSVEEFVPEQKYSFEKFDDFFWTTENGFSEDRSVTFDTLTIEVVPEPAGRLAALRSGDAQLIEANINMIGDINGIDGASIAWQKESSYNFITHDFGIVARMCDRVAVMYAGRIVEQSDVEDMFDNPAHPYTEALLQSVPDLDADVDLLPSIEGQPPSLDALPPGCSFAPRCPYRWERCDEYPDEFAVAPGHTSRCWRAE